MAQLWTYLREELTPLARWRPRSRSGCSSPAPLDGPRSGDRRLALLPLRCNSDQLFSVIWSSSAAVRAEGMRTIARTLEDLIFGQPDPPPPPGQLRCHLDLLQRVTLRCPYADVREAGEALISSLQV